MNQNPYSNRRSEQNPNLRAFWLRMAFLAVGLGYALLEMRFLTCAMGELWRNRRVR